MLIHFARVKKCISICFVSLAIMLIEGDADIIRIETKVFLDQYKKIEKNERTETLTAKKQEIYNNNKCFHVNFETYFNQNSDKKSYVHHRDKESYKSTKNNNRLHIISADFTEISKTKKLFTGYLNKLTDQNKATVLPKIKELLNAIIEPELKTSLYAVIWEFIHKSSDGVYIDILYLYDHSILEGRWDDYTKNKEWYPSKEILENNILAANEDLYDIYCSYVKWKKKITNLTNAWCILMSDDKCLDKMDILLEDLYELFERYNNDRDTSKEHKHIVDFSLEQMHIILRVHNNPKIIEKLRSMDINKFELSSKFLVLNILEKN